MATATKTYTNAELFAALGVLPGGAHAPSDLPNDDANGIAQALLNLELGTTLEYPRGRKLLPLKTEVVEILDELANVPPLVTQVFNLNTVSISGDNYHVGTANFIDAPGNGATSVGDGGVTIDTGIKAHVFANTDGVIRVWISDLTPAYANNVIIDEDYNTTANLQTWMDNHLFDRIEYIDSQGDVLASSDAAPLDGHGSFMWELTASDITNSQFVTAWTGNLTLVAGIRLVRE